MTRNIAAPAKTMSVAALQYELHEREHEWDELCASLEEDGGHSGSPRGWLVERMEELAHELKRRTEAAP